jgi:uncharacterized protein
MIFPTDPIFYALAIPAVLIVGISKSGFGGATGGLGVVLLAQVVSPAQAATIMLPVLCLMDIFGVKAYWRAIDWSLLKRMLPAALAGSVVGMMLWSTMSVPWLKALLAAVAIGFPLQWWWREWRTGRNAERNEKFDVVRAWGWCGLSGFTSFVAHAGGTPLLAYLMPKKLNKTQQVGTMSLFFLVVNYVKIPQYFVLNQFNAQTLGSSLVLAPLVPIGVWLGLKLHHRLSAALFTRACQGFMFLMGFKLAFEAWAGLRA